MRRQRGFSLLELLVALAVFSLLSVMAYGGLRSVLQAKQQTDQAATRLQQLQSAMLFLERDVEQLAARPIRDEYGDVQPALQRADASSLALTRAGWSNPTGRPRSTLQRVAYVLDTDRLVRLSWQVLDRAQDSEPYRTVLLEGVRTLTVRLLDENRQWQEAWPPQGEQWPAWILPLAVEVTLELDNWGEIKRIFKVPSGPALVQGQPNNGEEGG